MASPVCQVKDGAGAYASTTNGFNTTPSATTTIKLVSGAGVSSWSISCVGTDERLDAATINAGLTIDGVARTCAFTAPAAGSALRFQSSVTDANGTVTSTTFGIYTLTSGLRVGAVGETTEGNAAFGYTATVNAKIRQAAGGVDLDTTNTALAQTAVEVDTSDATPTTLGATFALTTDAIITVDAQVSCIKAGAAKAKVYNVRRHFLNTADSITASAQTDVSGPDEIGGALAATVAITYTGTTGRTEVTGIAATDLRWRLDRQTVRVTAAAAVTPPFSFASYNWSVDLLGSALTAAALIGTASAGASATHKLDSTAANTFAAGAAMNGQATYGNASDAGYSFLAGWLLSDVVAVAKNEWTAVIVMRPNTASTDGTAYHNNRRIIGSFGAYWSLAMKDDGAGNIKVVAGQYDVGFKEVEIGVTAATPVIVTARLYAGNLEIRTNKGAWTSIACGAIDTVTDYMTNYSANGRADLDIGRLSVSPVGLGDADCDAIATYLGGVFGIAV